MPNELKIKITRYKQMEEYLKKLGAKFNHERKTIDTYFNQSEGEILKVMESDKFSALINLKKRSGGFDILKYMQTNHPMELKKELEEKHGVKCILEKRERLFDFKKTIINLNIIKRIGSFIVVEGENLEKDFFTRKLGIKNPKFITKSFDDMKPKQKKQK